MKLRTKIHLFTTLLMLSLLIFIHIGIFLLYEQLSINTEVEQLQLRGEELLTTLNKVPAVNTDDVLRAYMPTNGKIRVFDENGNKITSVEYTLSLADIQIDVSEGKSYGKTTIDGQPVIMVSYPAIWVDGSIVEIQLIQLLNDLARNKELLKLILIVVTVLVAIPILLSNMALSSIIIKPLERLSSAMKKNATSRSYEKIELSKVGKDELAEIGRTFNFMMEALETNYKKQEQFVSNASHELKTPLTVIESYAKLLLRRGFTNEQVANEALEAIVSESSRMNDLIVQMLELAKNKEHQAPKITHLNVIKLLENTVSQMRQAYNRNFILHCEKDLWIHSDEQKLKQLLFILLDNARKYSEKEVIVTVRAIDDKVSIAIQDFGVGIPKENISHLFDRFYRVVKDRNRKTGGTGLGLSIAKEIADILQIEIEVESEENVGSTFTLFIPETIQQSEVDRE